MKNEVIQRAYDHLQPGGWIECQEVPGMAHCDDGSMPDYYGWQQWTSQLYASSKLAHRQVDVGEQLKDWMRECGFVDVHEAVFKIPLNGWPKDSRLKHVGMLWQRNLLDGLSGFSLQFFSKYLNKTQEEIEVSRT
jgi:metalloendopeptidase OMA1, mitochondrial